MATNLAFALAGLGGFNAHGAGFLTAARELDVKPDIVTATSGQIIVLHEWLKGADLNKLLIKPDNSAGLFETMAIALQGLPGVFRPAFAETLTRWLTPPALSDSAFDVLADRLWPAQQFVPLRTEAYLDEVVESFNVTAQERGIGVVFNAYNLKTGKAALFGNPIGQDLWPKASKLPPASQDARIDKEAVDGGPPVVAPIDKEAVRAALWLSLYGFDKLKGDLMDGAYHRPCLVSELYEFDTIYAVRPLANGWLGCRKPSNWFEVQDWQAEMWFSSGYKAEVDTLMRINALIDDGVITDPKYKQVALCEIAPETPAGYFNFFNERQSVFDEAYAKGKAALDGYRKRAAA